MNVIAWINEICVGESHHVSRIYAMNVTLIENINRKATYT